MSKNLFALFLVALALKQSISCSPRNRASPTIVEVHQHGNCRGWRRELTLSDGCHTFRDLENEISGVQMTSGSCAKIYKSRSCEQAESFMLRYPDVSYCVLPQGGWNDNIKGVSGCKSHKETLLCPAGSYVREILTGDDHEGIRIRCYKPTKTIPASEHDAVYPSQAPLLIHFYNNNYQRPNFWRKEKCPTAAFGLNVEYNNNAGRYHDITLQCTRSDLMETNEFTCERYHALAGLTVVVDEANIIKHLEIHCKEVDNPAKMCEPQEELKTIVDCDNMDSQNEMECTYTKTIGLEVMKASSKSEDNSNGVMRRGSELAVLVVHSVQPCHTAWVIVD